METAQVEAGREEADELYLSHLVSYETGEAEQAACHLVDEYLRRSSARERYAVLVTARVAARQAPDEHLEGLYWIAHDAMALSTVPLEETGREEQDGTGGDERGGHGDTAREDDREDGTRFHSSYNEFVSQEMKHYSDEERRSGKALQEIAEKWNRKKEEELP
ncbi:MAG: hypothetical protein SVW02_00655 [Candidatus Nanohaloarchaea archaeon]|nr:hypothetical protein [Candidatus Nanohaloarchaea archaeon]